MLSSPYRHFCSGSMILNSGCSKRGAYPTRLKVVLIGKAIRLVYLLIQPFVSSIRIHINRRVDHGMVHRGVKVLFVGLAAFYHNFMQLFFPLGWPDRCFYHFFKNPSRVLSVCMCCLVRHRYLPAIWPFLSLSSRLLRF